MKRSKSAARKQRVKEPGLTPNEARVMVRFVARQLAAGEITETQAYNHVADIGVLAGMLRMEQYFLEQLHYLGGPRLPKPIPMRLICPGILRDGVTPCAALHVDEGEFATKAHHTHACQKCGHVWRPAVPHTVGVQFLPGFKDKP